MITLLLLQRAFCATAFGGILQILLDLVLLVEAECRSTSGARLVIEAAEAPGRPLVDPGRYTAVVDLVHAGHMRHGATLVAQEETMRSHTGAPGGMRARHLVEGVDVDIGKGSNIFHRGASLLSKSVRLPKRQG